MSDIKLIALDLDGTLFNSEKEISPGNYRALCAAAKRGVYIVPATGRFFKGMSESVRSLPFLKYVITMNGAEVFDAAGGSALHREDIGLNDANAVFDYFEKLPVIFDCFQDGWGWMSSAFYGLIGEYTQSEHNAEMLRELRTPLEDFRRTMRERAKPVQKIQAFFKDMELRKQQLEAMPRRFGGLNVTSAIVNNIEVNSKRAAKGNALVFLCDYLGIPLSETVALGDDLNDVSMLKAAGTGIAMQNSSPEVLAIADRVTLSNNDDGVAAAIDELLR